MDLDVGARSVNRAMIAFDLALGAGAVRGEPRDRRAPAWLRGTEPAADALWGAGVGNLTMALGLWRLGRR